MACGNSRLLVMLLALPLAGCWGPSEADIAKAHGKPKDDFFDVSCSSASGKPGYVCTYTYLNKGFVLTNRFVKREDGSWDITRD